jgi:hypothetical protein
MATEAQIKANRLNAQHSTGPRTLEGKVAASRNALTSGLHTRRDYVRPEEQAFYELFIRTFGDELDPRGLLEAAVAEEIASATWRLRLCGQAEARLGDFDDATDKQRRSIERARSASHSVLHRNINQLRKLRTERPVKAPYVPDPALTAAEQAIDSIMNCPEPDWNAIDRRNAEEKLASNCTAAPQTPRNAPCPCRSGEKFKRCCGKSAPPVLGKAA